MMNISSIKQFNNIDENSVILIILKTDIKLEEYPILYVFLFPINENENILIFYLLLILLLQK